MNTINTHPEIMAKTVDTDATLNSMINIPKNTLLAAIRSETNKLYSEGLAHENLIVIPTYNEAERLTSLVRHLLQLGPFDILVVDDRSPDGTGELAEQLTFLFPGRVDILHQPERLGTVVAYTVALRYALKRGYTMIFSLEDNYPHPSSPAPVLRCVLNETGVVLSTDSEKSTRPCSFWRRLFSWGER